MRQIAPIRRLRGGGATAARPLVDQSRTAARGDHCGGDMSHWKSGCGQRVEHGELRLELDFGVTSYDVGSGCASAASSGRPCDGPCLDDDWPCILLKDQWGSRARRSHVVRCHSEGKLTYSPILDRAQESLVREIRTREEARIVPSRTYWRRASNENVFGDVLRRDCPDCRMGSGRINCSSTTLTS